MLLLFSPKDKKHVIRISEVIKIPLSTLPKHFTLAVLQRATSLMREEIIKAVSRMKHKSEEGDDKCIEYETGSHLPAV